MCRKMTKFLASHGQCDKAFNFISGNIVFLCFMLNNQFLLHFISCSSVFQLKWIYILILFNFLLFLLFLVIILGINLLFYIKLIVF